jgi:tRNA/rRNA methyltransferase
VRPKPFPAPEASAMASGALDILESARVCSDLDEALAGTTFSVALSARQRELSHRPLTARDAARELVAAAQRSEVAIVFGNETVGLTNAEIMSCTCLARIPASEEYASLNLGQAVQVMAYEIRMAALAPAEPAPKSDPAPHEDLERLYAHLERSLAASGFLHPRDPRKLMERLRRLIARAKPDKVEVSLLRGMLSRWDRPRGK